MCIRDSCWSVLTVYLPSISPRVLPVSISSLSPSSPCLFSFPTPSYFHSKNSQQLVVRVVPLSPQPRRQRIQRCIPYPLLHISSSSSCPDITQKVKGTAHCPALLQSSFQTISPFPSPF